MEPPAKAQHAVVEADQDPVHSNESPRPSKRPRLELWDEYRTEIKSLYLDNDKSLREVMEQFKIRYGFEASMKIWKSKLQEWNLTKNLKFNDKQFIVRKQLQREREHKTTRFYYNDRKVEQSKVIQWTKMEKMVRMPPLEDSDPPTPPDIAYETEDEIHHEPESSSTSMALQDAETSAEAIAPLKSNKTYENRDTSLLMRKVGACLACKLRKVRCHPDHLIRKSADTFSSSVLSDQGNVQYNAQGASHLFSIPCRSCASLSKAQHTISFTQNKHERYANVFVLLLCWEHESNLQFQEAVEQLQQVLKHSLFYSTEIFKIPLERSSFQTTAKLSEFILSHEDPRHLIIVYYGGQSSWSDGMQLLPYTIENIIKPVVLGSSVSWGMHQFLLEQAKSDVLILLDSCAPFIIGQAIGCASSVTECIAASGPSPLDHDPQFTYVLIEQLKLLGSRGPFTPAQLYQGILSQMQRQGLFSVTRSSPVHIHSTTGSNQPRAMVLQKQHPTNFSDRHPLPSTVGSVANTENDGIDKNYEEDMSDSPFLGTSTAAVLMKVPIGTPHPAIAIYDSGCVTNFISHKAALDIGYKLYPLLIADMNIYATGQGEITPTHYVETEIKSHQYNTEWHHVKFMVVESIGLGMGLNVILGRNYIIDHKIFESVVKRREH